MTRIRLNLSYDGTDFYGWQIQPEKRTVQGELEKALSQLYATDRVKVMAAGRTDRGVHALMQVVHYDAPLERDQATIIKAMRAILPPDIQIWQVLEVDDKFHSRFHACQRSYAYNILKTDNLFLSRYGWKPRWKFAPEFAMELSTSFLGKRNWLTFATQPEPDENPVCHVQKVNWIETDYGYRFHIVADRFLRRMVRTIVGTLVQTAAGLIELEEFQAMLDGELETAGTPAPPQGLALTKVLYPDDKNITYRPMASPWGEKP